MNNNSARITELLHETRGTVTMTPERTNKFCDELLSSLKIATPEEAVLALAAYGRDLLIESTQVHTGACSALRRHLKSKKNQQMVSKC